MPHGSQHEGCRARVRVRQMSVKALAIAVLALFLGGCGVPLDSWNPRTAASYVPLANGCDVARPILWGPDFQTGQLYCETDWVNVDDPTNMYGMQ